MAPSRVVGDAYFKIDGQLLEIKRQLRQGGGYPYSPLQLMEHLQAAIEGNLVDRLGRPFEPGAFVPADGEWFDLGVDYDIDPQSVAAAIGRNPESWDYIGPYLSGKRILKVKLVRLGRVRDLEEAMEKAEAMDCRFVEGQALGPFMAKFLQRDYNGPIIFGGSQWRHPSINSAIVVGLDVTCNDSEMLRPAGFYRVATEFPKYYRWLVTEK